MTASESFDCHGSGTRASFVVVNVISLGTKVENNSLTMTASSYLFTIDGRKGWGDGDGTGNHHLHTLNLSNQNFIVEPPSDLS